MDQFTKWDDDTVNYTSWDDVNGGPLETTWDLLPAELKIDQLAVVRPAKWKAEVVER